jgi:hypothetical protein
MILSVFYCSIFICTPNFFFGDLPPLVSHLQQESSRRGSLVVDHLVNTKDGRFPRQEMLNYDYGYNPMKGT